MGLFGKKKEIPPVKASELFSQELMDKINTVVATKSYGGAKDAARDSLVDFAKDPDKVYEFKDLGNVIYSAGVFTKVEPDLAPMLNEAITKYKTLKKG
ncbi:MAG: hypothetical protein K5745_07660 [Saccharofermentans sp.]|nr:hypothetical protein [Saccharofermentans sp.]